jgi:hypothetical protein
VRLLRPRKSAVTITDTAAELDGESGKVTALDD